MASGRAGTGRGPAIGWAITWALACGTTDDASAPGDGTSIASTGDGGETSAAISASRGDVTSDTMAALSSDADGSTTAAASEDDTGTTGEPPSGLPEIPPTMGTLALDFRVAISGSSSLLVGAFDLVDGVGTIEIEGETQPVFVYERQPWPEQNYTLYQALAISDDGWTVLWFYCGETGLDAIYLESTDGIPLQTLTAEGTCDVQLSGVEVELDLPGTEFAVLYNGEPFTIDGPEIAAVGGELGSVAIDGVDYVLAPFETVDCSSDCGAPGWYEVHTLLWDPVALRVGFAIVYFEVDGTVRMTYGITLPDLVDLVGDSFFEASWAFG